jgi:hypothetical protein
MVRFVGKDPLLGTPAPASFLAANFFQAGAFGAKPRLLESFKLFKEKPAGEKAVLSLMTGGLTFDLKTGGTVNQHDASRRFVDVLAAMAA